jgi:hypothetical protein
LIPLLLAAGAVGVKLNALPLLVVACVYYVWRVGLNVRRVLRAGALVALLLLPTLAHRFFVSGCPLYPSKVLCVEAPWAVGVKQAELHTRVIREWARWDGRKPEWANGWNWVGPWLTRGFTPKNAPVPLFCLLVMCVGACVRARTRLRAQGALLLLAGCAGLVLFLLIRGGGLLMVLVATAAAVVALTRWGVELKGRAWVLAAGLAGTALMLYAGPALRFGLGYTAILFAALLVPVALRFAGDVWPRWATLDVLLTACGLLLFTLTVAIEAGTYIGAGVEGRFRRLLVPPPLPEAVLSTREVNGLRYSVTVESEQCWAAAVPCAPSELPEDMTLRDPARGLGAGFVRQRTGQ